MGAELGELIEEYDHVLVLPDLLHHKFVDLFVPDRHRVHFTEFGQDLQQGTFKLY